MRQPRALQEQAAGAAVPSAELAATAVPEPVNKEVPATEAAKDGGWGAD
jgi:hypothetical protein